MGRHEQALMMETGAPHPDDKMQPAGDPPTHDHRRLSAPGEPPKLLAHNGDANSLCLLLAHRRCCLLMSLLLALLLAASLVALSTFRMLEPDAPNSLQHWSIGVRPSEYRLFATKTSYSGALSQLLPAQHRHTASQHPLNHQPQQPTPPVAHPFQAAHPSTEQLHLELTSQHGCTLRQLHLYGRHAARYPSATDWAHMSSLIGELQALIQLSNLSPPPPPQQRASDTSPATAAAGQPNDTQLLLNPLLQYKLWTGFMTDSQANQVMRSGALETQAMARRYQMLYPNLFQAVFRGQAARKPQLGVTSETRTAQTAINFVAALGPLNETALASLKLDHCEPQLLQQVATGEQTNLEQAYASDCFGKFSRSNYLERLEFHKQCQKFQRDNHTINNQLNLDTEPWLTPIAASVANKLNLHDPDSDDSSQQANNKPPINHQQLKAIYQICKYETALNAHQDAAPSIWCNLFSQQQLQLLEYVEDLDDYFYQAYGHHSQAKSACVLTNDLMRALKFFRRNPQPEIRLFFTHSQVIQRLIAAAVDLESDEAYRPSVMQEHLLAGKAPDWPRRWRTSLMSPFSANLAFTVYQCPPGSPSASESRTTPQNPADGYPELDPASPFKLVASLNERPILMDGCSHVACDLDQFLDYARFNIDGKCKLDEICLKKVVVN